MINRYTNSNLLTIVCNKSDTINRH